jgi:hypothetical protein
MDLNDYAELDVDQDLAVANDFITTLPGDVWIDVASGILLDLQNITTGSINC